MQGKPNPLAPFPMREGGTISSLRFREGPEEAFMSPMSRSLMPSLFTSPTDNELPRRHKRLRSRPGALRRGGLGLGVPKRLPKTR